MWLEKFSVETFRLWCSSYVVFLFKNVYFKKCAESLLLAGSVLINLMQMIWKVLWWTRKSLYIAYIQRIFKYDILPEFSGGIKWTLKKKI